MVWVQPTSLDLMARFFTFVFLFIVPCTRADDLVKVRSRTDQFVVYGASAATSRGALQSVPVGRGYPLWTVPGRATTNELEKVHLVPGLVAVSCERIKEALLHELGEQDAGGRR